MELTVKNHFKKYGYAIIRNFFSKEEITKIIETLDKQIDKPSQRIFLQEEFWELVTNKRLTNLLEDLINEKVYFLYHADSRSTSKPEIEYSWHRDNPCRQFGVGDDWNKNLGNYSVLRIGIYFQKK